MFDRDYLERLESGRPLSPADEAHLDAALAETEGVGSLVSSLADDQPSLAWRSELNEKVRALGVKIERKRRMLLFWRPVAGLAVAGALAFVITFRPNVAQPHSETISEAHLQVALMQEHRAAVCATEIAGAGLAEHEAVPVSTNAYDPLYDWSEVDVETL